MIRKTLLQLSSACLLAGSLAFNAYAEKGHHKHALDAHEHGTVKLAFAIEDKTMEVDMEGPAESFIGFEHMPKTENEKLAFSRAQSLWTAELLTKLIMVDSRLNCQIDSATFEQISEAPAAEKKGKKAGEHSEIEAKAKISCKAAGFKGTDVKIGIKDKFPKIKDLTLEVLGTETKSLKIKKTIESVRL